MEKFYDDAELAILDMIRIAHEEPVIEENVLTGTSAKVWDIARGLAYKHSEIALPALMVAFARHAATLWGSVAESRGMTVPEALDDWAVHKMSQHIEEVESD